MHAIRSQLELGRWLSWQHACLTGVEELRLDSQNPRVNKKLGVVVYAHNPRDGKMGGGDQWPPEIQGPASLAYLAKFQANKRLCLKPKVLKGMASTAVPLPTHTHVPTHAPACTQRKQKKI